MKDDIPLQVLAVGNVLIVNGAFMGITKKVVYAEPNIGL
jgi:hypothetical protein